MALSGKQRRSLRAFGHHLSPVVQLGQQGVVPTVVDAVLQALSTHELIKVKIGDGPLDRHEAADALARETGAELAQLIGRTALLFKQRKEKSRYAIGAQVTKIDPKDVKAAPAAPKKLQEERRRPRSPRKTRGRESKSDED